MRTSASHRRARALLVPVNIDIATDSDRVRTWCTGYYGVLDIYQTYAIALPVRARPQTYTASRTCQPATPSSSPPSPPPTTKATGAPPSHPPTASLPPASSRLRTPRLRMEEDYHYRIGEAIQCPAHSTSTARCSRFQRQVQDILRSARPVHLTSI